MRTSVADLQHVCNAYKHGGHSLCPFQKRRLQVCTHTWCLQEIITLEEDKPLSKALRLKKKVLQEAYEHALQKKKVGGGWFLILTGVQCSPDRRCCMRQALQKKKVD